MVYRHAEALAVLAFATGAFMIGIAAFSGFGSGLHVALLLLGLLLLCAAGWALRIARRPHPHMRRHQVLHLAIAEIEGHARAGEPFELQLGRSRFEIAVQPAPVTDEAAPIIVGRKAGDGAAVRMGTVDSVVTFAGKVSGRERSEVRLTITDTWLSGYVMTDDEWWFVEPMRRFRAEAALDEYVAYRTRDLRFKLQFDRDVIAPPTADDGGSDEDVHPIGPVIFLAMLHDWEYKVFANDRIENYQRSLINGVNGIFSQVGIEFRIAAFIYAGDWLKSGDASELLAEVREATQTLWGNLRLRSERRRLRTEIAHATTGKWLRNEVLGVAYQPGVFSLSHQQLVWASGGGGSGGGAAKLLYQNMMVTTHELGHNFNASHNEADKWCALRVGICLDYERTLMWPEFYDDNQPFFSNGSITAAHNNAQRIRDNVATGRIRDF